MKLLILSDLHFEFHADHGKSFVEWLPSGDQVDACVLAGDIAVGPGLPEALKLFCDRYAQVVYTHGNHEFYGYDRNRVLGWTWDAVAANDNLTWLDGEVKEVAGRRFLGGPMWFRDTPQNAEHEHRMNDFRLIGGFKEWVYEENLRTLRLFKKELRDGDIVVTHYLPTEASVAKEFRGSDLNLFFLCDVEALIRQAMPELWVHGHTHTSCDYHKGPTRVVCNPFGYARYEENPRFDFNKIVEVP